MKVSVIIPTYNEIDVIKDCINSLSNQSQKDYEIIVVDDGSTDGTLDVLMDFNKRLKNFRYFRQSHNGAGAARNFGAKESRGEILVFVDADMTFDNSFLKKLIEPIVSGKTKGTWSREEMVSNWANVWSRCWNINEGWENGKRHPKDYPDYQPVFRAILKSEFNKIGGYEPGGYTDDWSLSKKLGYEAVNAPGAIFYHKNPASLVEVFLHAKWVAKRKYKFGVIGYFIALIRSSLPVSILVGLYKSILNSEPKFIIFKIVYDLGIFVGVIGYMVGGKGAK